MKIMIAAVFYFLYICHLHLISLLPISANNIHKELFQIFTGAKLSLISKDAASNDTHMICNLLDF